MQTGLAQTGSVSSVPKGVMNERKVRCGDGLRMRRREARGFERTFVYRVPGMRVDLRTATVVRTSRGARQGRGLRQEHDIHR